MIGERGSGGDPPRLLDSSGDVPAELKALLEGAQNDLFEPERVERVASTLTAGVGVGASLSWGSKTFAGLKLGHIVTVGLATVGLTIGAVFVGASDADEGQQVAGATPTATTVATSVEPTAEANPPRAATATEPTVPVEPPETKALAAAPQPVKQPKSEAQVKAERRQQAVAEHRLLRAARAALKTNPSRALSLTQEHRRKFPSGMLTQEREVIAIDALARLGRSDAAKTKASEFEKDYPGSVHKGRVDEAVKDK